MMEGFQGTRIKLKNVHHTGQICVGGEVRNVTVGSSHAPTCVMNKMEDNWGGLERTRTEAKSTEQPCK